MLVLVNDRKAYAYYGAHSLKAREVLASEYLILGGKTLGEDGAETLDLMGVTRRAVRNFTTWGSTSADLPRTTSRSTGRGTCPYRRHFTTPWY